MKRGPKPRKINQDLLEQIEHHAARGLSQKQNTGLVEMQELDEL